MEITNPYLLPVTETGPLIIPALQGTRTFANDAIGMANITHVESFDGETANFAGPATPWTQLTGWSFLQNTQESFLSAFAAFKENDVEIPLEKVAVSHDQILFVLECHKSKLSTSANYFVCMTEEGPLLVKAGFYGYPIMLTSLNPRCSPTWAGKHQYYPELERLFIPTPNAPLALAC